MWILHSQSLRYPLEGVRAGFEGDTQVGSRDMDQITVNQVFAKLKSLGWVS